MISAVVVFAFLIFIFSWLIPGMRKKDRRYTRHNGRRPIRTFKDLAQAGAVDDAAGWVTTFIGLLALASMLSTTDARGSSIGVTLGLFCGLLTISRRLSTLRDSVLSVIGAVAAVIGAMQLLAGNDCGGEPIYRFGMLTVTLVAFGVGLFISGFTSSLNAKVGLQAFVVIELVTFFTAPMGVDLVGGSQWVAIATAVASGLLVGASPEAILSLFGLGLGVVTLWASTQTADGCGMNGGNEKVVVVLSGIVTYFISAAVVNKLRR